MERRCPVSGEGSAPVYDADLFCDDFIRDPYPHYAAMRELGPVVWLPRHCNFAVTRYQEVKEALRNWQTFSAAQGVAADQIGCDFLRGNTLASDPPIHDTLRVAVAAPLLPGALKDIRVQIEQAVNELIIGLTQKKSFDGIGDLARVLPVTIVTELVGLPEDGRENMLKWAGASFDILGVQNERGQRALETIKEMRQWITTRATPDRLKPGSWTWRIHELAKQGAITEAMAPLLIRDYINPSLDTTISAIGELIYRLGKNPDQWQLLRRDPTLVPNAVQEAVRLCAPIRTLSRTVVQDTELGGVALPASSRVMLLFASANRDEKKFPDPDRFDVTRPSRDHMSFGNGVHMCVGLHLARLEMESILNVMIPMVARIEVGEPTVAMNNTIRGFAMLPVTFDAAKDGPTPKGASERNRLSALAS